MTKKTPDFDEVYSFYHSILNQVELSNTVFEGIGKFSNSIQLYALTLEYGPRTTKFTAYLIKQTAKLLSELFTDPENLKPLSKWTDDEKAYFFGASLKTFAAQTHNIKTVDRIYARLKDVKDFAHEESVYLLAVLGLSIAALLLVILIVLTCFTAPLVAIPLFGLLALVIKGLHAFITITNTHSDELVKDQEVTNLCQILLKELKGILAQQDKSSNSENSISNQEVLIPETRKHGRFTLPLSFFKPDTSSIPGSSEMPPASPAPLQNAAHK